MWSGGGREQESEWEMQTFQVSGRHRSPLGGEKVDRQRVTQITAQLFGCFVKAAVKHYSADPRPSAHLTGLLLLHGYHPKKFLGKFFPAQHIHAYFSIYYYWIDSFNAFLNVNASFTSHKVLLKGHIYYRTDTHSRCARSVHMQSALTRTSDETCMSPGPLRLCKKTIWAEHVSGRPFTRDNKLAVVPQRVSICRVLSCSRETYNALTNWLTDARTLASPNIVIILCGNKKDLDADREVTFLEASRFAQENGNWWSLCLFFFSSYSWFILSFVVSSFFSTLSFFFHPEHVLFFFFAHVELMFLETSALTGENVEEGFLKCARTILNKIDSGTRCFLY